MAKIKEKIEEKKEPDPMEKVLRKISETSRLCVKIENSLKLSKRQIAEELQEQREFLTEITRLNANIDETLGNVLLAIRQNEYLQAHYPAQNGFPELKVVGRHPSKIHQRN